MFLQSTFTLHLKKIGSCSLCMRSALFYAIAGWFAWLATSLLFAPSWFVFIVLAAAILLSANWMTHVVVYVVRSKNLLKRRPRKPQEDDKHVGYINRRNMLATIARATAVATVASLPTVLLSKRAMAFCGQCTFDRDCGSDDSNWCCKNTAPVNAGYVCNECKKCV